MVMSNLLRNNMKYIQDYYKVPAKVGDRILFKYDGREGTIKGSSNSNLLVLFDGEKTPKPLHPTWEVEYL